MHLRLHKILLAFLLFGWASPLWAGCPSRTYTYATGQTIDPSQVTTNEDSLFTYSCAVDTFATGSVNAAAIADGAVATGEILDGTIVNADVSSSAAIAGSKLSGPINTATALAANGANCSAGNYPLGVDASGAVESCTAASTPTVADRVHRTSADVTTTSTSLVDFTGASITLTTGANPVQLGFAGGMTHDAATKAVDRNFDIDGTLVMGTRGRMLTSNDTISSAEDASLVVMSADLTAASHTFKFQWATESGTATMRCNATDSCNFWVVEVTD